MSFDDLLDIHASAPSERREHRATLEREFREQITADFKAGKIGIENGWLFVVVDRHTCGTGEGGHYGAHEPGCGTEAIMDLWTAGQP